MKIYNLLKLFFLMRKRTRALVFVLIFLLILIGFFIFSNILYINGISRKFLFKNLFLSFSEFSFLGFFIFYVIGAMLFVPTSYLTIYSGIIFGEFYGAIYSIFGIIISSIIIFFLSRIFARPFLEGFVKEKARELYNLDLSIEKKDLFFVLILRILPIPFGLVNIFLGVTRVSIKSFFIGTLIWMIPETFFLAYVGSSFFEFKLLKIIIAFVFIICFYFLRNYICKNQNQI